MGRIQLEQLDEKGLNLVTWYILLVDPANLSFIFNYNMIFSASISRIKAFDWLTFHAQDNACRLVACCRHTSSVILLYQGRNISSCQVLAIFLPCHSSIEDLLAFLPPSLWLFPLRLSKGSLHNDARVWMTDDLSLFVELLWGNRSKFPSAFTKAPGLEVFNNCHLDCECNNWNVTAFAGETKFWQRACCPSSESNQLEPDCKNQL